jgi:hypothetical protein
VAFHRHICGTTNTCRREEFHREAALCKSCGVVSQFRGPIYALDTWVTKTKLPLAQCPKIVYTAVGIRNINIYVNILAQALEYTNTSYHTQPFSDISKIDSCSVYEKVDFIISSDVLACANDPI